MSPEAAEGGARMRRSGGRWLYGLAVAGLVLVGQAPLAQAQEHSLIQNSSLLGESYGASPGPAEPTPPGALDVVAESAVFVKNLELFHIPFAPGYTRIGCLFPLRLRYRADPRLTIELGATIGRDFGDDAAVNVARLLGRLTYEPFDRVFVIAGSLLPTHWIHDAMLDDTRRLLTYGEEGVQLRVDREHFKHDQWIHWRIREGLERPEAFEIGSSSQLRLFSSMLWIDGHFLWSHVGGQINAGDRVEHNLTFLAGVSFGKSGLIKGVIGDARLGVNGLWNVDHKRNEPEQKGQGIETFGTLDSAVFARSKLRFFTSYFDGQDFHADLGDPLYRLDRYAQFGLDWILRATRSLRIEVGYVLQWTDNMTNYSYLVNFVWDEAFPTPIRPRLGPPPPLPLGP